jgi:hypothetical protein
MVHVETCVMARNTTDIRVDRDGVVPRGGGYHEDNKFISSHMRQVIFFDGILIP